MATQVSIDNLSTWLSDQPDNTVDTPYEIEITGLLTSNVINIKTALINNSSKYVDLGATEIPYNSVLGSDDLGGRFAGCTSLIVSPVIPAGIQHIGLAFSGCTNMKVFKGNNIPDRSYSSRYMYNTGDTFQNCTSLTTIECDNPYESKNTINSNFSSWGFPHSLSYYTFKPLYGEISKTKLSNELGAFTANTANTPFNILVDDLDSSDFPSSGSSTANPLKTALTSNLTKYVDLTTTSIPYDVTSLKEGFYGCSNLIAIPMFDLPSEITDMTECFKGCTSLKYASGLPDSVTTLEKAFEGCVSLEAYPSIPSSVTNLKECFKGCTSLTSSPQIPNRVTNMQECFSGCTSLVKARAIPNSVTNLQGCFYNCTSLKRPPALPSGITSLESCFQGCSSLTVNGGEGKTEKCIAIYHGTNYATSGYADDTSLFPTVGTVNKKFATTLVKSYNGESIDLEHDTLGNVTISDNFPELTVIDEDNEWTLIDDCWAARNYIVENTQTGVKYLCFAPLYYHPGLVFIPLDNIVVDNNNKIVVLDQSDFIRVGQHSLYADNEFIYTDSSKTEEIAYKLGSFSRYGGFELVSDYLEVGETFYIDNELTKTQDEERFTATFRVIYNDVILQATAGITYSDTKLEIPSSVTNLSATFRGCESIADTPEIPSAVTNMTQAFYGCSLITVTPELPNGVTTMEETFYGCTSLETVPNIPASVTNLVSCFEGDSSLESIDKFDITAAYMSSNKTNFEDAFSGCTALTHIGINSEITPEETVDFHLIYLDFFTSSNVNYVKGKIYSRDGTSVTIPQTAINKSTMTLPVQTDELMFATISDVDLETIINKMLQNHRSWFGKSVLDPEGGSLVLWANNKNKFVTNLDFGGGGGSGIEVYPTEEDIIEDLPNLNDGDIVASYGDGEGFNDAPLGAIADYYGATDPSGGKWLICDGRDTTGTTIELETHYPSLYLFLGGTNVLPDYSGGTNAKIIKATTTAETNPLPTESVAEIESFTTSYLATKLSNLLQVDHIWSTPITVASTTLTRTLSGYHFNDYDFIISEVSFYSDSQHNFMPIPKSSVQSSYGAGADFFLQGASTSGTDRRIGFTIDSDTTFRVTMLNGTSGNMPKFQGFYGIKFNLT